MQERWFVCCAALVTVHCNGMSASTNMHILGNNIWIYYIKLIRFFWSLFFYQYEICYGNYFSCRSVLFRLVNCANIQYFMAVSYHNASACFCVTETNLADMENVQNFTRAGLFFSRFYSKVRKLRQF